MRDASLRKIAATHHRSFEDDGRSRRRTLLFLYAPAMATVIALGVIRWLLPKELSIDDSVGAGLIAALTLLAGLLFSLGVTLLDKAIDLDLARPAPSAATSRAALRLQALSANALFTAALAGSATALLILGALIPRLAGATTTTATGLVVAVGTSGVAVSGRLFAETLHRTDRTRTGESHRDGAGPDD